MSTRAFNEHNGKGFGYLAFMTWPTVIGPIVFIPTGVAVGLLDQCVFSPIWDTLCIPADLTVPVIEMRIVDLPVSVKETMSLAPMRRAVLATALEIASLFVLSEVS